jgi:ATP-dependent Clp protease, protease subunit
MINKFIDEAAANQLISIMLYLRDENPREKISMYFNVPGGQVRPSLAIYDLMENTKQRCEIETVNLALCAGFSSLLCAAGTKGKRHAFPNARFLLQRVGMDKVFRGQATDIALEVRNVKAANDRMEKELATLTGQPTDKIATDLQRDMYLVADEAVQYRLIDSVLLPSPRKRAARGGPTDLGTFEGEEDQRYQGDNDEGKPRFNRGGQPQPSTPPPPGKGSKNNDDDEPKTFKG